MKGRFIQDNIHMVHCIVEQVNNEAMLINLNQYKAFDRVDHRFVGIILKLADFGPYF